MWAFPTVHCEAQRRGIDETLRVYVYSVLSDLVFFISSTDCSSAVGSTWVCVLWDVNKKPLIASCSLPPFGQSLSTQVLSLSSCPPLLLSCPSKCWYELTVCVCVLVSSWALPGKLDHVRIVSGDDMTLEDFSLKGQSAHTRAAKERWDCRWVNMEGLRLIGHWKTEMSCSLGQYGRPATNKKPCTVITFTFKAPPGG